MLTVGQFSKICQVSTKTLHHYDKIGLVKPEQTDKFTGYRYYSEEQLPLMLLIQRLKRYGFTLTEIKNFLGCEDKDVLYQKLKDKKLELERQCTEGLKTVEEMGRHLQNFERTSNIMGYQDTYEVEKIWSEDLMIISSRQEMSVEDFGKYFEKVFMEIVKKQATAAGRVLAIYHDEEFHHEKTDIEVAAEIREPEKATRILRGGLCASTVHRGAYSGLSDAYGALVRWVSQNGYQLDGCPYEIYRKNEFDGLPVQDWETQVIFPIKESL